MIWNGVDCRNYSKRDEKEVRKREKARGRDELKEEKRKRTGGCERGRCVAAPGGGKGCSVACGKGGRATRARVNGQWLGWMCESLGEARGTRRDLRWGTGMGM